MLISAFAPVLLASAAAASVILPVPRREQAVLQSTSQQPPPKGRKLHGRFLHITDIHPDPFYVEGTDPEERCHRNKEKNGAGHWGAEMSDCDTPWSLVNETFRWIEENLKDEIDFIVWTGDSARHDNDYNIPRNAAQIFDLNRDVVGKMREVFGRPPDDRQGPWQLPIVPTLGNNDIFPHNIMLAGPSHITREYENIWREFIPSDQYHVFQKGAYFWQQVIPGRNGVIGLGSEGGLVVVSLNTLYFFNSNTAVDGCDIVGEPGYDQFEWLNVQLQIFREQGTKVILTGHVPPTWTSAKQSWDAACWKKYVVWSRQYRDIITGHLYGHMNLDHFFLSDTQEPKKRGNGKKKNNKKHKKHGKKGMVHEQSSPAFSSQLLRQAKNDVCSAAEFDPEEDPTLSISSAQSYLQSIRESFAEIPVPEKSGKSGMAEYKKNIGGKWGERYIVTHVGPSVVPNYFPTLRVIDYNITGLVDENGYMLVEPSVGTDTTVKKGKKKPKKPKDPGMPGSMPDGPDKTAPPGPAYSVQPFTFLGYKQYYANLTSFNAEYERYKNRPAQSELKRDLGSAGPPSISYEVEYDTHNDTVYKLKDMTVRSYIKLAHKLVDATRTRSTDFETLTEDDDNDEDEFEEKGKKHGKKKHRKRRDKIWHEFVKRAFVGTVDGKELEHFRSVECQEEQ